MSESDTRCARSLSGTRALPGTSAAVIVYSPTSDADFFADADLGRGARDRDCAESANARAKNASSSITDRAPPLRRGEVIRVERVDVTTRVM